MKVTPTQLKQVVTLERHRHFGVAAEHLGISQPALSRSVQSLESRLGSLPVYGARARRETNAGWPAGAGACAQVCCRHRRTWSRVTLPTRGARTRELSVAVGLYPAELTVMVPAIGDLMAEHTGVEDEAGGVRLGHAYGLLGARAGATGACVNVPAMKILPTSRLINGGCILCAAGSRPAWEPELNLAPDIGPPLGLFADTDAGGRQF